MLGLARELLRRIADPQVRELEVRQGGIRVKVAKGGSPAAAAAVEAIPQADAAAAPQAVSASPTVRTVSAAKATNAVTAPLTGVFYRSGSPQAPPFVQVGSVVSPGDVIGLIEAMKLFNEVRSTVAGRVRKIVAENGQLVRAHQPIVELE